MRQIASKQEGTGLVNLGSNEIRARRKTPKIPLKIRIAYFILRKKDLTHPSYSCICRKRKKTTKKTHARSPTSNKSISPWKFKAEPTTTSHTIRMIRACARMFVCKSAYLEIEKFPYRHGHFPMDKYKMNALYAKMVYMCWNVMKMLFLLSACDNISKFTCEYSKVTPVLVCYTLRVYVCACAWVP